MDVWRVGREVIDQKAFLRLFRRRLRDLANDLQIRRHEVRFESLAAVLEDGRRGSSWIDTGPYCSAAGWPYDEGISVPLGSDLPEMVLTIPLE